MKVALLLKGYFDKKEIAKYDYIIGVDRGALDAIENNINIDYAIGDFDSVTEEGFRIIEKNVKLHRLNPVKDETDTLEALRYAYSISSDVTILGGIQGKRIEHFISNIALLNQYPNLKIMDENSLIYLANESFEIANLEYKYVSFFAYEDVPDLTLSGFKYPLTNYNLKRYDPLCVSNEIISNPYVTFTKGKLLVIFTKNDN